MKNNSRTYFFYFIFLALTYYMLWIFDGVLGPIYDILSAQRTVVTYEQIDQQLANFEQTIFSELAPNIQERFSTSEEKISVVVFWYRGVLVFWCFCILVFWWSDFGFTSARFPIGGIFDSGPAQKA